MAFRRTLVLAGMAWSLGALMAGPVLAKAPAPAVLEAGAGEPPAVDQIVVRKAERVLLVYRAGKLAVRIDHIQLGAQPFGAKHFQGDERTPEGHYTIDFGKPDSDFHLALHISYPAAQDRAYAKAFGRSPGGAVYIHGQPNDWLRGRVPGDWTAGCIALTNAEIETLWRLVPDGTPIDILP